MHIHTLENWQHSHNFSINRHHAEQNTKIVMVLTAIAMVVEVVAGILFGSMALLADGWHMVTHLAAFGITLFAYRFARSQANNPKYTFGTGKASILGGFTSAIALGVVAFVMALESLGRLWQPQPIQFNEAIGVAAIGLVVNLVSALLLQEDGDVRHHGSGRHHHHHHHHSDSNLHAAYLHVVADALTSVLAIVALITAKFLGWIWMDAVMGLVGAGVITKWAYGLIRETGFVLLDAGSNIEVKRAIADAIEMDADNRITDLHVWHLSEHHLSATIALVTHYPKEPNYYKSLLDRIPSLAHILIEVNPCCGEPCIEVTPGLTEAESERQPVPDHQ